MIVHPPHGDIAALTTARANMQDTQKTDLILALLFSISFYTRSFLHGDLPVWSRVRHVL